jgi:hypothetical protein
MPGKSPNPFVFIPEICAVFGGAVDNQAGASQGARFF